jgi:hypothetical protein
VDKSDDTNSSLTMGGYNTYFQFVSKKSIISSTLNHFDSVFTKFLSIATCHLHARMAQSAMLCGVAPQYIEKHHNIAVTLTTDLNKTVGESREDQIFLDSLDFSGSWKI